MSETPSITAAPNDPSQDAPEACLGGEANRSAQRLAMLRELAEIGMRLARGVERQAEEPEAAPGDVGLVFSRIARAVRQTLALEARLEEEFQVRAKQEQGDRDYRRAREARAPIDRRSRLVRRAVASAIEADTDDIESAEQLLECLDERLGDREADDDFMGRPIGELVALICKNLGVRADLSLWEDEAWAMEEAAARARPPSDGQPAPELAPETAYDALSPVRLASAGAPSWLSG